MCEAMSYNVSHTQCRSPSLSVSCNAFPTLSTSQTRAPLPSPHPIPPSTHIPITYAPAPLPFPPRSPRLLPLLSQALRDKHRELRAAAAAWLLLVCEAWDLTRPALSRALPEIETTLLKGCEDADPRARALCRKAFAAYHARAPGNKGAAALSRAPPALQGRLGQECAEYAPSGEWAALEATYRPAGECWGWVGVRGVGWEGKGGDELQRVVGGLRL